MVQKPSREHYNSCIFIAQMSTVTPQLLSQIDKIRQTELWIYPPHKDMTSLKKVPSPALSKSLPYWFLGNFAAMFVLNYWLREFPLSAIANRFEWRCEPKQLMLLYYKICPCYEERHSSLRFGEKEQINRPFLKERYKDRLCLVEKSV